MSEVKHIQERQRALIPLLYNEATAVEALHAYDRMVEELEELLGPDAHANQVDPDLFSLFSDLWKDEYGSRPRHHITRIQARRWINNRSIEQVAA